MRNTPTERPTVREEIDYWSLNYLRRRMYSYGRRLLFENISQLWGMGVDDMVSNVLEKALTGQRNWEKSKVKDFVGFLLNGMHSEIGNYLKKENRKYINEGKDSHFLHWKNNQDKFLYNAF